MSMLQTSHVDVRGGNCLHDFCHQNHFRVKKNEEVKEMNLSNLHLFCTMSIDPSLFLKSKSNFTLIREEKVDKM